MANFDHFSTYTSWCERKGAKKLGVSKIPKNTKGAKELPPGFDQHILVIFVYLFLT